MGTMIMQIQYALGDESCPLPPSVVVEPDSEVFRGVPRDSSSELAFLC